MMAKKVMAMVLAGIMTVGMIPTGVMAASEEALPIEILEEVPKETEQAVVTLPKEQEENPVEEEAVGSELQGSSVEDTSIPAPEEVTAVRYAYDKIKISWKSVEDVDGYLVFRRTDEDPGWQEIACLDNGQVESFVDKYCETNVLYTYTVCAYIENEPDAELDEGTRSQEVSAKATLDRSELTSVVNSAPGEMTVSWKEVEGAEGYRLYGVTDEGKARYVTQIRKGSILSFTEKNLEIGKSYRYLLRAYRKVNGEYVFGPYSLSMTGDCVMEPITAPKTPVLVSANSYSYNKIKIIWEIPEYASGFRVYRKAPGDTTWTRIKQIDDGTVNSYIDTTAKTGVTYTYTVKAYRDTDSERLWSGHSYKGVSSKAQPNKGGITSITNDVSGELTINWKKISGASGYRLYRVNDDGSKRYVAQIDNGSQLSYTEKNLEIGNYYYYVVRAYRTVDGEKIFGYYSNVAEGRCIKKQPSAPGKTELEKASSYSYNKIKIWWKPVDGADGYMVYRKANGGSRWIKIGDVKGQDSVSYLDTNCVTDAVYNYTVRAYTLDGEKKYPGKYDGVGLFAKAVPNKSGITSLASKKSREVTIQWKKISGAHGYRVYRTDDNGKWKYVTQVSNGQLQYTEKGMKSGKTYRYKVRAYHIESGQKVFGAYSDGQYVTVK